MITATLFAHFFADFVLQTRWMAENKSRCGRALMAHISTYTLFITFFACYLAEPWYNGAMWGLANGFLHFMTDFVTSQISSRLWDRNRKAFWGTIGLDQWIHAACLINTLFILELK